MSCKKKKKRKIKKKSLIIIIGIIIIFSIISIGAFGLYRQSPFQIVRTISQNILTLDLQQAQKGQEDNLGTAIINKEWRLKQLDKGWNVKIENSTEQITEICLYNPSAKSINDIDLTKSLYDREGIKIKDLNRQVTSISAQQKYGYCYTTKNEEYIKFGEHSTILEYISIINAEHLDENREFISDISDKVKYLDNNFSEEIPNRHFVRVVFQINLTSSNDITFFANSSGTTDIEVYLKDSDELIDKFYNVSEFKRYSVYLNNFTGSSDTFDLKIIGNSITFDQIVDPPIEIDTCQELQDISNDGTADYILIGDVDCGGFAFSPLFHSGAFTGSLNGQGYTISNLLINITDSSNENGLFGDCNGPSFGNFSMINFTGQTNGGSFGAVCGAFYGDAKNIYIQGSLSSSGGSLGGAFGSAGTSTINNITINISLSKTGTYTGGLAGTSSTASISNITIYIPEGINCGTDSCGGLIGEVTSTATLKNIISYANLTCGSSGVCGGLVGYINNAGATITNATVYGNVSSTTTSVGGLVGSSKGIIKNSSAYGDVSGTSSVGGFAGGSSGTIDSCKSSGDVYGSSSNVAGFVGSLSGTVNNSYSTGNVVLSSSSARVGGFIGDTSSGNAHNSYAIGNVTNGASASGDTGGFVGEAVTITFKNCFSTGGASGGSKIGIFGGDNDGATITNVYGNNHTRNPDVMWGSGTSTGTAISNNQAYFYDISNAPLSSWDFTNIWCDLNDDTDFPTLIWEGCAAAGDSTPPLSYLQAPTNDSTVTTATHYFNATFTDETALSNSSFMLWNSTNDRINVTNSSIIGTQNSTNLSVTLPYEDDFHWNYRVCDSSANCASNSSNWSLSYTTPQIDLEVLYPTTSINVNQNNFFNVTVNITCRNANCGEVNVSLDPPTKVKKTSTTTKICKDKKCNLILYSGTKNVYEDGMWKDVKDAKSLKGSGIECVVESDGEHFVECLDWNYTTKKIKVNIKDDKNKNKDIPIINYKIDTDLNGNKISIKDKEEKVRFEDVNEKYDFLIKSEYNDELHFGEKSTVVVLQDANTENLEDTYVDETFADTNYGSLTWLSATCDTIPINGNYILIKFNISTIPSNQIIDKADFNMYLYDNGLDSGESINITAHHYYNQTWLETFPTWNNKPTAGTDYNTTEDSKRKISTGESGWKNWTVLNSVITDYNEGNSNYSLYFLVPEYAGTSPCGERNWYYSKEYSNAVYRPFLNITYTESPKSGLVSTVEGATPFYTNGSNPNTTTTLNKDVSKKIIFWVNATGSTGVNHTFYVYTNQTADETISNISGNWYVNITGVATDTTFSVTMPTETTTGVWHPDNKSHKNVDAHNQTSSVPLFNITNDGNVDLNISLILNATTSADIVCFADDDNTPTGGTVITNVLNVIHDNLASGDSIGIWLWTNFTDSSKRTETRYANITVEET